MWRLLPLLMLPMLAVGISLLGLQDKVVWSQIGARMQELLALADQHVLAGAVLFILCYAALATACLPVGPAMGVLGGALFGSWLGTGCAILGATAGAVPLFLWARATFRNLPAWRYAEAVARVQDRLQQDGFLALLALRVAPVLPSWALNLAAALARMRLAPFVAATMLGLVPATALFASVGAGLGGALADGAAPASVVARPAILLPLLALSVLVLIPVVVRAAAARRIVYQSDAATKIRRER